MRQSDLSEISGNKMDDGPWTGSFTASTGEERYLDGISGVKVTIEDSGTFSFTVAAHSPITPEEESE